jgi:hypothetical protein
VEFVLVVDTATLLKTLVQEQRGAALGQMAGDAGAF